MDPLRTTEVHRRPATSQEFCARLRGFEAALRAEKGAAVSIPPAWTGWGSGDEPPDALPPSPPTPAVLVPASEHASSPAAEAPALPLPAGPSEAGPSADPLAATPARRLLLVVGVGGLDQHFASKRLPILLRGAKQSKRFDAVRPLYTCKLECCTAAVTPPLPAGEVTHLVIVGESNPPSETVPLVMREARALVARSEGASIAASPVLLAAEWVGNDLCAPGREAKHTLRPPPAARSPPPEEESPSLKRRRGASAPNSPARSESPAPALAPAAAAEAAAEAARSILPAGPPSRLDDVDVRQHFACQAPVRVMRNLRLAKPLEELAVIYKNVPSNDQDQYRALVFGKAAKLLLTWWKEVETDADLEEMAAEVNTPVKALKTSSRTGQLVLGPKSIQTIRQMLGAERGEERAACERLRNLLNNEQVRSSLLFTTIWGVGPSAARQWFQQGLRTFDDLRSSESVKLSPGQQVGLKYVAEFQKRIPRAEVEQIAERCRRELVKLLYEQYGGRGEEFVAVCEPVGSYRRGRPTSGDADILICLKEGTDDRGVLQRLVHRLTAQDFITDSLALPDTSTFKQSYMGVCCLGPGSLHRRIDVKLYPRSQLPFALLYFTGSDYFNRSMRHYAKAKGLHLGDHSLYWRKDGPSSELRCASERDVFDHLGLEWRDPNDRELAVTASGATDGAEV